MLVSFRFLFSQNTTRVHTTTQAIGPASQQQRLDTLIWTLALPIALSLAAEPLYSMVDTYAVGKRMGSRALSAFSLAERVFVIG